MAGQTNSWMGHIQISNVPCIGDTIHKRSSVIQDGDFMNGDTVIEGESQVQTASLWWLIVAGLAIGLIYKSGKKQRQT